MADNPWLGYLEQQPAAGYAAWLAPYAGRNAPETFWDAMQKQYQNYWGKYQGELGQQIMGDETPTLKWLDYLARQSPMSAFRNLSGYQQGQQYQAPLFRFIGGY